MQLTVKKIIIDSFKGVRHAEYDLSNRNIVSGRNASGKTTIADAHLFLWANCDYTLNSNPEIHPDFMEESEPSVTEVIDIDGTELEVKKIQQDSRTKKQKEDGAPVRIKNTYEINGVPKSQTDFVAELTERGVDFDKFLLLSHIDIFTSQKSQECRDTLFGMVSDVTDEEIAKSMGNCQEAAELLATYKPDEVMALQKRTKKHADEQIEAIPNQIIGLEKAKEDVDVDSLIARRDALQGEISDLKAQMEKYSSTDKERLTAEITSAESALKAIGARANAERLDALSIANNAVSEVEIEASKIKFEIEQKNDSIKSSMAKRESLEKRFKELEAEFATVKEQTFVEENCAYCGQPLPQDKTDELRREFEEQQNRKKAQINSEAKDIRDSIKGIEDSVHKMSAEVKELVQQQYTVTQKLEEARQNRALYSEPVDVTGSEEYKEAWDKLESLKADLAQSEIVFEEAWKQNEELVKNGHEMKDLNDRIAQAQVNDRIDAQIAELKTEQKNYAQEKANAEKVLYQLSLISMEKNKRLTEQVNSHFSKVRFRLFRYQKNGEVVNDCTPMVLTKDGEYRDMNYGANTSAIMQAQLDIIKGLSEFYGINLPCFVDGAEQFDSENLAKIEIPNQMIYLCVSEDELKVRAM